MTHLDELNERIETFKDQYSISPSYIDLLTNLYKAVGFYYNDSSHSKPCIYDSIQQFSIDLSDVYYVFWIALLITAIRYVFEQFMSKRLVNWLELTNSNKKKFAESAWKSFVYTLTWFYCLYLLKYRYNYFDEPYLIWDDYSVGMNIPSDIKLIYFIECGFYIHSIYATLYMDTRRKDFYIMIGHHVLTVILIAISYAIRFYKIGLLVLFLHDIADICLEMTKLMRCLIVREGNRQCSRWQQGSYVGFGLFTLCWFVFRLYWYPLKVLYTTGVVGIYRVLDKDHHLYISFNILLWILFCLNIYWFFLILQVLYKILAGSESTSGDVRESDDEETSSSPNTTDSHKKRKE